MGNLPTLSRGEGLVGRLSTLRMQARGRPGLCSISAWVGGLKPALRVVGWVDRVRIHAHRLGPAVQPRDARGARTIRVREGQPELNCHQKIHLQTVCFATPDF